MCVIIGNLLDNATEANMTLIDESKRFIRIYIGTLKNQLYISISNAVGETPRKVGGNYLTTKGKSHLEGDRHGFGLMRVDRTVGKYDGYINRQNEEGVFVTEVMIPL